MVLKEIQNECKHKGEHFFFSLVSGVKKIKIGECHTTLRHILLTIKDVSLNIDSKK